MGDEKVKKISKIKIAAISISCIILIGVIILFNNIKDIGVYSRETNGNIVSEDGIEYQFNGELTSSYAGGEVKAVRIIGRFKDKSFFETLSSGPKIIKLEGYDEKDTFLVRGLMLQEVYTKRDK